MLKVVIPGLNQILTGVKLAICSIKENIWNHRKWFKRGCQSKVKEWEKNLKIGKSMLKRLLHVLLEIQGILQRL